MTTVEIDHDQVVAATDESEDRNFLISIQDQISAKLTKGKRDALPESDFAVPGKRKLPIHDEKHVRMAWSMIEKTDGLSDAERSEARRRILARAKALGIDTSEWEKLKAMAIEAMALEFPDEGKTPHSNKMPFSGILTRIGEASDGAPHGSGGKRILITHEAAEKALPSLLGMGVNMTGNLGGHDPKAKIGIITAATIEGDAIVIEGFVYRRDFPAEAKTIKAMKSALGFSFEADQIACEDSGTNPVIITGLNFTGASILLKNKAAYHSTSLAAALTPVEQEAELPAQDEIDMTKEEMQALLDSALKPLAERLGTLEAAQEAAKTADPVALQASTHAALREKVEPHAVALEKAADDMHNSGIGAHPTYGHAAVARRMAASLRAAAAGGMLPTIHRDHDWPLNASEDVSFRVSEVQASEHLRGAVEPHAAALESCAAAMESAGIGTHAAHGHAAKARRLAASLRCAAALGNVPHMYNENSIAAATDDKGGDKAASEAAIAAAVQAAVTPLKAELEAMTTKLADVKAAAFKASPEPERKTLPPAFTALLAKAGIGGDDGDGKVTMAKLDEALTAANVTGQQSIAIKRMMRRNGQIVDAA